MSAEAKEPGALEASGEAFRFEDVLAAELDELRQLCPEKFTAGTGGQEDPPDAFARAHEADLTGLAFSGGGIRSATFNLGVIQGLAKRRESDAEGHKTGLMSRFDYLSTVSGGGYIGSWLSAWLHRDKASKKAAIIDDDFQQKISTRPCGFGPMANDATEAGRAGFRDRGITSGFPPLEHAAVRFLRRYTNYLSPRVGLSGDMLALVSLVLRNLVLLQLALISLLATALFIPYVLASFSRVLGSATDEIFGLPAAEVALGAGILIILLVLMSCSRQLVQLPDKPQGAVDNNKDAGERRRKVRINWSNGILVLLCTFASWLVVAGALGISGVAPLINYIGIGALVYTFAWIGGYTVYAGPMWAKKTTRRDSTPGALIGSVLVTLLAGAVFGAVSYMCAQLLDKEWAEAPENLLLMISVGPPVLLLLVSFVVTVHIGIARDLFNDLHREWWARIGGFILLACLAWSVLFAIAYFAPPLAKYMGNGGLAVVAAWVGASGVGAWIGRNTAPAASVTKKSMAKAALMRFAPWIFLLGLAAIVSFGVNRALIAACPAVSFWNCSVDVSWPTTVTATAAIGLGAIEFQSLGVVPSLSALLFAGLVFALISMRLDINIFSAHSLYRNRLVRAYLGASRAGRRQSHVFTGFDPNDDVALEKLTMQRPIPILNTTINMTGGDDLAWQTRRASSFVFTPQFVGYETKSSQGADLGGYRMTAQFATGKPPAQTTAGDDASPAVSADTPSPAAAGEFIANAWRSVRGRRTADTESRGLTLGTAMAVSGAAASPNMGYHSSPAIAALLTAFNLRLGFWVGNPAKKPRLKLGKNWSAWWKKRPVWAGRLILSELTGSASAESAWVNLSDGGHFDNLGIYELVRRRCRFIVVTDAGCDPDHEFTDLANTIRKCWTDLGVHIFFPDLQQLALNTESPRVCEAHGSLGLIEYPDRKRDQKSERYGLILYLKCSLTKNEIDQYVDIRQYASANEKFPHQSTADQFFDENQFEAYRHLGFCVAENFRAEIDGLFDNTTGRIDNTRLLEKALSIDARQPHAVRAPHAGNDDAITRIYFTSLTSWP